METTTSATTAQIINKDQLLTHWLGHRKLTRKVLEAFPEKELFEFSLGGMRPFAKLIKEMLAMAAPTAEGLATNEWEAFDEDKTELTTKAALLDSWDESTEKIERHWKAIPIERFQQHIVAFGQYEGSGYSTLFYIIDNEIHHRGQGYVYLRALGITPPNFWEQY
ncbi:putative damage-inducible protein DinB [Algoriphagus sp. 4150]|uniref:DinB family protein n=1 Tax=Algoriphagus sp. 4150 TaxID=2817756 RepID=UPI00285F0455|nr:DinB family protein [Algoriphagus sp. 4150]MDR7129492.1 putative damage-inducible protein DinB [Algoriphagus sp. 4150]